MATDEIVRGRQCRNASFARHSENRSESGVVSGLAARVTTPLRSLVTRAASKPWQARRQAFAGHRACIKRLGRPFGTVPSAPRAPPAPRHARSRPWRRAFRVARPWRAGPVDAGDSGSQKDRRRTTALRRLLHCNNSSGTTASGHHTKLLQCNNQLVGRPQRAGSSGSSSRRSLRQTHTMCTCFGSRR